MKDLRHIAHYKLDDRKYGGKPCWTCRTHGIALCGGNWCDVLIVVTQSCSPDVISIAVSYMTTSLVLVGVSLLNTVILLSVFHGGRVGANTRLVGWARSAFLDRFSRFVCLATRTRQIVRSSPPWIEVSIS